VSAVERIVVDRVSRLFGATAALRNVSVTFESNTLTFVQGPNGAGKSTLLAILATVIRPTSGRVTYEPLGSSLDLARPQIGWVGHDSHCYRDLTGKENVELAAQLYGLQDPKGTSLEAAGRVAARAFWDKPLAALSRGQRQRVALARALVHRPSVLLLDEPLTGLDRSAIEQFDIVLGEERDRGTIVIVVNHTEGWAERLGGKVVRIEQGRRVS
jgi:heme exporter protein A